MSNVNRRNFLKSAMAGIGAAAILPVANVLKTQKPLEKKVERVQQMPDVDVTCCNSLSVSCCDCMEPDIEWNNKRAQRLAADRFGELMDKDIMQALK